MYLSKFPELYGLQESPSLETGFHQVDMPGVCFSTQLAICLSTAYMCYMILPGALQTY